MVIEPLRQCRLEQFAAELVAGQPDGFEHGPDLARIIKDLGPRAGRRGRRQGTVQQPQSGFAMITAGGAKFIQDERLMRTTGSLITAVNAGQRLAFGG